MNILVRPAPSYQTSLHSVAHVPSGNEEILQALTEALRATSRSVPDAVARCDDTRLVGLLHEKLLVNATLMAKEVSFRYIGSEADEADAFCFLVQCLCAPRKGKPSLFESLCATLEFSSHEPLERQCPVAWIVCRAAFGLDAAIVDKAVDTLLKKSPEYVAACGFMAAMVQTPLALKMLSHVASGSSTALILCVALEHEELSTHTTLISIISAIGGELADIMSDLAAKWFVSEACELCKQACLAPMSEHTRRVAFAKALQTYSIEGDHLVGEWNNVESNIRNIGEMSYRVLRRRTCSPFVVLWFLCRDAQLMVFARPLIVASTGYQSWVHRCAQDVSDTASGLLKDIGIELCAPTTRAAAKRAHDLGSSEEKWSARCVDAVSRAAMERINAAQQNDGSGFLKAHGGFQEATCVCFCSMYM